ncbi:UNVERIFIED_ORG: hypothetical protein GGR68_002581 [Xanthomonas campestris]
MRHPCRVRSRDGERARTRRDGRCAWLQAVYDVCWSDHRGFDQPLAIFPSQPEQQAGFQHASYRLLICYRKLSNKLSRKQPTNSLVRCPCRLRDPRRHGCRRGASTDGFTACPASGEGIARSTHLAFDSRLGARLNGARLRRLGCFMRGVAMHLDYVDRSGVELLIYGLAAGPLPAHPRRTRRKYVPVGSYAASVPRKVPRGWADKDQSRWSVCMAASYAYRVAV